MLFYEKIKGELLSQEQNFCFGNLTILHTIIAEDEFSCHILILTIYTPPPPQVAVGSQ
jgi:hypothetical protein